MAFQIDLASSAWLAAFGTRTEKYNFTMFGLHSIPVGACARRLAPAACAVVLLAACGQKGPLFMPKGEAAAGRATLGDLLSPSTAVSVPTGPASSVPGTGKASPVHEP